MATDGMKPKVQLFCEEFLKDFNGTQAAIRAGYSERSATEQAYDLLRKPQVAALIEQRKAELMAARKMTLEKWVDFVTHMALYDPRKFFDAHGNCKDVPSLSRRTSLALGGFEVEEVFTKVGDKAEHTGYVKKYKLLDRTPYVQMLGKYLNAFPSTKVPPALPPAPRRQFDLSKLTDEEFKEHLRLRKKATVTSEEQTT